MSKGINPICDEKLIEVRHRVYTMLRPGVPMYGTVLEIVAPRTDAGDVLVDFVNVGPLWDDANDLFRAE